MRPALLIVGAVLLVLGHLEAVHNAYLEGFSDAVIMQEKNPTVEVGPKGAKETPEVTI
jgi:hypothetical protein